ncbi:MAG: hypothetical protein Q9182_002032 [Xanthomendoza sp. 2 TL-2023]
MSWLWRGFQSAVFYYVSCAPCHELAYRRRRRKGAARSKAEKETDQGLYTHPSPFSTNVYWHEDMAMGPGPPQRNGKTRREKERQRWRDRVANSKENKRGLMTGNSTDTGASSADTVVAQYSLPGVAELEQERRSGDGWNRRRYQREDEYLWGLDDMSDDGAEDGRYYTTVRNPSVSELHPPIASSLPASRSEAKWMLQPPPSAKIMEGKVQANRSRSGSGGSNGSSKRGEPGLARQLGERMMEEKKRRKGNTSQIGSPAVSRVTTEESGNTASNRTRGQRHDRDEAIARAMRKSTESRSSVENAESKAKPNRINIPPDGPRTSGPISRSSSRANAAAGIPTPGQRPPLSTVVSSTAISPVETPPRSARGQAPSLRPALPPSTASSSSLRVLQELTCPSTALNSARPSSVPVPVPASSAAKVGLPGPDGQEDEDLEIPAVESLWPGEFGFNEEGVGERRLERWSMDI